MDGLLEVEKVLELLQANDVRGCSEGPPDTDDGWSSEKSNI